MGSLRHLNVSECGRLKELPDGIGRLTLLQTLDRFPVAGRGKGGRNNIGELGGLNRLRGHLTITNLKVVGSEEEARTAKLQDKTSLVHIWLQWGFGESHPAMGVLESLRPPPKLELLSIFNYPGGAFPSWMGDAAFLLLSHVELWNCENCTQLPPLGQLPCLKFLSIHGLSGVKKVGEEFLHLGLGPGDDEGGTSIVAFPQLETLVFESMDRWERWAPPLSSSSSSSLSWVPVNTATADASILPRLRDLRLEGCPKLEGVPPIFTTALQRFRIGDCPELRSLQFLPPSLQSLNIFSRKNLRTLPEGLTRLTNLQELLIDNCTPELRESCQVGGLLWPRIAHIPRIQIDFVRVQNAAC